MDDAQSTVRAYVDAWNEPAEAARRELLHRSWADDGVYTDPLVCVEGREALVRHSRKFADRWPGARVVMTSGVDEHHGFVRFTWRLVSPGGEVLRDGMDFGELCRTATFAGSSASSARSDPRRAALAA